MQEPVGIDVVTVERDGVHWDAGVQLGLLHDRLRRLYHHATQRNATVCICLGSQHLPARAPAACSYRSYLPPALWRQQTSCMSLPLSINGTDRRTDEFESLLKRSVTARVNITQFKEELMKSLRQISKYMYKKYCRLQKCDSVDFLPDVSCAL